MLAVCTDADVCLLEENCSATLAHSFKELGTPLTGVACSPNGQQLAVPCHDSLHLLDVTTATSTALRLASVPDENLDMLLHGVASHDIVSLAYSPSGKCLAAGTENGLLYLITPTTGTVKRSLMLLAYDDISSGEDAETGKTGHAIWSLAYAPDSMHLIAGLEGYIIGVIDTDSERQPRMFDVGDSYEASVLCMALSPTGIRVFAGGHDVLIWFDVENLVNVIDDDYDCLEPSMFDIDGVIVSLSMSPCGAHLAMGTTDGFLYLLNHEMLTKLNPEMVGQLDDTGDLDATIELRRFKLGSGGDVELAFSQNGLRLAVGTKSTLYILDPMTCATLQVVQCKSSITGCAYLSIDDVARPWQEDPVDIVENTADTEEGVIQFVDEEEHLAVITPLQAASTQEE